MASHINRRRRGGLAVSAILVLSSFASTIFATEVEATATATSSLADVHETLVMEERPFMTQPPAWYDFRGPHELRRRAEEHSTSTASEDNGDGDAKSGDGDKNQDKDDDSSSTTAKHASKTGDSKDMASLSSIPLHVRTTSSAAAAAATDSPLPAPFDGVAASGFQSSGSNDACSTFMTDLLESADFQSCYPLSMMLQTSNSFFDAEKKLSSIVRVLDATCDVQSTQCASYFSKVATNLTTEANCKVEYDAKQANVMQAYNGLVAYKVLYDATCLQDPEQDMYCFAEAVTNASTVSDNYLYFLPFGLALPGASTPSCNWCIKHTMAVFHAATADHDDPLYKVYAAAANQVNTICGVNWVNTTVAEEQVAAAIRGIPSYTVLGSVLAAAVLSMVI